MMDATFTEWLLGTDYLLLDWLLLSLLIVTIIIALLLRDLLASALILGVSSLLVGLLYLLWDAPDVALTEAAVGAGISSILFIAAIALSSRDEKRTSPMVRMKALLAVCITGSGLCYAVSGLPAYTDYQAPIHQHVAPYYIGQMQDDIGIPNLVTAILASYRGYDTMGETAVIFTAGLSIMALMGKIPPFVAFPEKRRRRRKKKELS